MIVLSAPASATLTLTRCAGPRDPWRPPSFLGGMKISGLAVALMALCMADTLAQVAGGLDLPAERARISAERARISQTRTEQEAQCQTRFAVTGCVEDVRNRWKGPLAELDRQEQVLGDLDRRQRSTEQALRLERKASDAQADAAERSSRAASELQSRESRAAAKASGPRPAASPRQAKVAPEADRTTGDAAARARAARSPKPAASPTAQTAASVSPQSAASASPQAPAPASRAPARPASPTGPTPEQARANAAARTERLREAEARKAEVRARQASRSKPAASDLPTPR